MGEEEEAISRLLASLLLANMVTEMFKVLQHRLASQTWRGG